MLFHQSYSDAFAVYDLHVTGNQVLFVATPKEGLTDSIEWEGTLRDGNIHFSKKNPEKSILKDVRQGFAHLKALLDEAYKAKTKRFGETYSYYTPIVLEEKDWDI